MKWDLEWDNGMQRYALWCNSRHVGFLEKIHGNWIKDCLKAAEVKAANDRRPKKKTTKKKAKKS